MSEQQVKRRRVTRACDECRKKKVKCDGQQPCIHCTVYAYECTYNQPSKRSNNSSTTTIPNNNNGLTISNSSTRLNQNMMNPSAAVLGGNNSTIQLKLENDPSNKMGIMKALGGMNGSSNNNGISPQEMSNMNITPTEQFTSNNSHSNSGINIFSVIPNNSSYMAGTTSSSGTGNTKKTNTKKVGKLQNDLIKYQQLFSVLLPNLPQVETLDIPTFSQIVQNFKGHSVNYLEDAVKEYHLISGDSVSLVNRTSPGITSPDGMSKNVKIFSTNSADSNNESVEGTMSNTPNIGREIKIMLPPKNIALHFVENTWKYCCVLLRFYHRPLFIQQLNELYDTDPTNYTQKQINFLPLCYSIMAVGALFSKSLSGGSAGSSPNKDIREQDETERKLLQDEGYKYFIAARKLIDITNTRDLNSIQTVVMLFIFLQCSARLSTCYAYIGVAMRSVLREGYHRLTPANSGLNPIEIEVRKRLFYTIYKLDIYVNAMLGLPRSISVDDFDQTLPVELSDENITVDAYLPENQHSVLSSVAISNHHTKLIMILSEIVAELYPVKRTNNIISHETVTNLELKLRSWVDQLPKEMKPNATGLEQRCERANKLLHLSFLHVQIILYRPFIHYVSHKYAASAPDPLSLQRARNCINVSRTVVKLGQDMLDKSLIAGSYWYANYTIFYSVAGLLFYTHEAEPSDKDSAREYYDILKDAEIGRNLLLRLKDSSMAANRTYNILNKLFEKLNTRTIQLLYPWDNSSSTTINNNNTTPNSTSNINYSSNVSPESSSYDKDINNDNEIVKDSLNFPGNDDSKADLDLENFIKTLPQPNQEEFSTGNSKVTNNDQGPTMFNYNSNTNELLTQSESDDNFKNMQNVTPIGNPGTISSLSSDRSHLKPKPENNDNMDVLNVFDQLDAQLFGKYVPDTNLDGSS
ncbi:similar to Saccharomyces cerevisiae YIL130W ASG1 Zinc cluster protein proposed to function as a transcriptional regulator involved in the stress response [Maudiozyma barnettii]|uniref:Similar to Saccharomyces cerevisiae YIL130W ASG1 Zinc cluster protein proposed to function as a transcriptional regulator involved in the stress response n=1 Tax=Maudiozyma barnettii TaxID=61262 RepID=A0A8H2VDF3_9SACH|nr:Asg1p [Kazachstania barnettii]CAB4253248.1 similar to Saccharomyces cerevisiae YIL130W ASG1 Zinc cluster protein proposed to function as a transcriptional regulator involved in the stress response [Kazachstania barnettii]CAD1780216.1 similar to Saccharomyces cerevisiae YIL130W ASG1 Zinc cluster protein proposed to function as a transcriptional regulator involved in the stress response [Kazachstania barnettii]